MLSAATAVGIGGQAGDMQSSVTPGAPSGFANVEKALVDEFAASPGANGGGALQDLAHKDLFDEDEESTSLI